MENAFKAHPQVVAQYKARLDVWYSKRDVPAVSGLRVKELPRHNYKEAWRDGEREAAWLAGLLSCEASSMCGLNEEIM